MTRSAEGVHRETTKWVNSLSNRLRTFKEVGSAVELSAKPENLNETSEGGVGKGV